MSILSSLLSILDWGKDKIPIQDRKERWKNEIENLIKERNNLLQGEADAKKAKRVTDIDKRIAYLNQLFKNASSNS